ncbi:alpha/beta hydrolase [Brevibacterium jeotgali]|uniref:Alpha/beta hydrolase family protein n=1 Tax=Brevibacterium jeotgali TaxID=1262550 RepID=A0A2H1L5Y1_9MICO|nr:alpha/beta hydrolase [Brevibacterium jeotgali]TWC01381.1 alpha/beta hydrolase family protein [Brevibacterium jeotgali]SMY12160.1 Alpha/beta hydrolase family protein [Brevibacterium jeotgali]
MTIEGTTGSDPSNHEEAHFGRMLSAEAGAGRRVAYGSLPDQYFEWFGDPHTAGTVVILIHGGYFRERTTLAHVRPMAHALVSRGERVAVALLEYRRAGGAGGHPRTLEDVENAIAHAAESVGDVRWVVAGHSAGGSLALSWATRQQECGPEVRVRPLAPVTDLVAEARDGLGDGAVVDYMGASPAEDLSRYLEEDPRSRAALIPARLDVLLIHGTRDATVDVAFSRGFPAARLEVEGADHFDLVDPQSPLFDAVVEALLG